MKIGKIRNEEEVLARIPESISDGSQTVTTSGTRVQLTSTSTPMFFAIITALSSNTGTIWVGGSTVASGRGMPLVALQSCKVDVDDLSKIYIDSTVNGEGVSFVFMAN